MHSELPTQYIAEFSSSIYEYELHGIFYFPICSELTRTSFRQVRRYFAPSPFVENKTGFAIGRVGLPCCHAETGKFSLGAHAVVVLTLAVYLTFSITRWIGRGAGLHFGDTANVVRQIQTLSDLVTVKYVVEKVVILDAPPESTLGQFVQGDNRMLLLAHGIVKAGINLQNLKPGDVTISGKTIRIKLPPAQITDAYLDENQTKVIDWKQGFLRSFDKDLEQKARQMAVEDIRRAARTDGILNEATQRAQLQLAVIFNKAGFEHVEFPGQNSGPLIPNLLEVPNN